VPDFLVRLSGGKMLALEIKGTDTPQNKAKRDALDEWVKAINSTGGIRTVGLGCRVQAGRYPRHRSKARVRCRAGGAASLNICAIVTMA